MTGFRNIGFVSTRIAGTDGVSLEINKWATVLERNNYACFYLSGENDRHPDKCMFVEEAHFLHPDIRELNDSSFGQRIRPPMVTEKIHRLRDHLKSNIYDFVKRFDIDLIIPENVLAIPLNVPLALALVEFIAETGFPTVAHHHDFSWERERFLVNSIEDYLAWAFPPNLPTIQHVVINSIASHQLSYRKGISNTIIPNVHDFASPPMPYVKRSTELRQRVGLGEEDLFILHPTRVVPRKWIERSLEIVSLMNLKNPSLIISHSAEDEGSVYNRRIQQYARNLGIKLVSLEHLVGPKGSYGPGKQKKFTIGDVYRCADLVCYPSGHEGFGNAFLETVYYRKPIVVNRYSIYITDIEPKGFDTITMEGFVTDGTIQKIREVLNNEKQRTEMVEKNFEIANSYFSYEVLERLLLNLVNSLEIQCEGLQ